MKKKIDYVLMSIFLVFIPAISAICVLFTAYYTFILYRDELAEIPFTIAAILSATLLVGMVINVFIISLIKWIVGKVRKNKEKKEASE